MGASATFMMIVTSAPWITKSITSGLGRGSQWATHGANSKRKFHSLPRLEAHHTYGLHGDGMQRVRSLALWCFSPTACLQGSCKLWGVWISVPTSNYRSGSPSPPPSSH